MADANGHQQQFASDALGRLSRVVEYSGTTTFTTAYTDDARDRLTQVTATLGHATLIS